jgi:hypothetical protein
MNSNPVPTLEILKGLQVERSPLRLRLTYQWRYGRGGLSQSLGEIVFFVIGLAFFTFPLLGLLSSLAQAKSQTLLQCIVPLPFLLIGLFIIYRGLGLLVNRSVFEIDSQGLKTRHGLLPFLGDPNLNLSPSEIVKVEWKQVGQASRQSTNRPRSSYSATYAVVVQTAQGQELKLLSGLPDRDYAFALQGELARFLQSGG